MKFQKGQSGNPGGRPKERPITDALAAELKLKAKKGSAETKLARMVRVLVETACVGHTKESIAAAKLIFAYIEGLPTQKVEFDVRRELEEAAARVGQPVEKVVSIYERLKATG